jgi:competence protein ComEC
MQYRMMFLALMLAIPVVTSPALSFGLLFLLLVLCLSGSLFIICPVFSSSLQRRLFRFSPRLVRSMLLLMMAGGGLLGYSSIWLSQQIGHRLPVALDGADARMRILVESVDMRSRSLALDVRVLSTKDERFSGLRHLQLGWYFQGSQFPEVVPVAGEEMDVLLRLRAVRGFANGLPFDYEAYQLRQRQDARGYIRAVYSRQVGIEKASWRQSLLAEQKLRQPESVWPWIAGLAFGEQGAFDTGQWRLAQITGTLHLLVVSGLHLGLVVGLVHLLLGALRRLLVLSGISLFGQTWLYTRLLHGALLLTISALYVWLAGAGVALQRAWMMLAFVVVVWGSGLRLPPLLPWALALLVILLLNPLMLTAAGFQYSLLAVLMLLLFLAHRQLSFLQSLWLPQWLVFLALMPVSLGWLQPVSLVQLPANAIAIPVLGLLLLPLVFLNILWPGGWFAEPLIWLGEHWWSALQWAADGDWPMIDRAPLPVLLCWGLLLLLLYLGVRPLFGWIATGLMLLLIWTIPPRMADRLVLLDVGQGLALLATQNGRGFLYDTGARYSDRFDAGSAVVLPMLRQAGVRELDTVVISHSDNDHAGGVGSLLAANVPVANWFLGQPLVGLEIPGSKDCHMAEQNVWHESGVAMRWKFMSVPVPVMAADNDFSCVVMLEWYGRTILLSGDLGIEGEAGIVARYGSALKADILIAGHHGSRSSSSDLFLRTVVPDEVWFSSGFHNRFGHPHPLVLDRLRHDGIPWRNTADEGAIWLFSDGSVQGMRSGWQPVWRQP